MTKPRTPKVTANYFGKLNEPYESPFDNGTLTVKNTFYLRYVKRGFDFMVALVAVTVTLPVNLVLLALTFLDVGRPIFFIHERPGLGEKPFKMVKFRNMTNAVDANGALLEPAMRITRLGRFVRKTSLDELLQFWLILFGKMSLIGPRPLLMMYLPRYSLRQHRRHAVRPGLECPMPVYTDSRDTWETRLENDVWYVENVSLKTDCLMLLRLFQLVFNSKRAKVRASKLDEEFDGASGSRAR